MDYSILAENLKRVRKAKRKSQQEIAEAAGITRLAYANIEKRGAVPRAQTIDRIAKALGVGVDSLLRPVKRLNSVRFRSRKRMVVRDDVLAAVSRWLEDFNAIEQLAGDFSTIRLRELRGLSSRRSRGGNRALAAAAAVRQYMSIGPKETIRDICGMLEWLGVKVYPVSAFASDAFSGLSVSEADGGPAVVVNAWERITVEHRIFTAAHELGHLLLHLDDYDVTQVAEDVKVEKEANAFASHLLMPQATFKSEWSDAAGLALIDRVMKIKRIFRVSYRTVLFRLREMGVYDDKIWARFQYEHQQRTGRTLCRADEPAPLSCEAFTATPSELLRAGEPQPLLPSDFVEDRLNRVVRKAVESGGITLSRAAQVLQISLGDMRKLSASWSAR